MYSDIDDQALLQRHTDHQDTAALEELFRRHVDFLYRTALRWRGNAHDAEDAVQTTLLHVLHRAKHSGAQYRGRSTVRVWLTSILLNGLRRAARDDAQRRAREVCAQPAMLVDVGQDTAYDLELTAAALKTVDGLPQHYRMPVSLHYMESLTVREVATALALSEKTVRSQIARGLEQLRESLAASGFAVVATSVPAVLAAAKLPAAPAALYSAIKVTIAESVGKGMAAIGGSKAAAVASKGAAGLALKSIGGVGALIGVFLMVLLFTGSWRFSDVPSARPVMGPATDPVTKADAPSSGISDLSSLLEQKIDVNFWHDYPREVLAQLKCRTGLPYAYADFVNECCLLDLKQNGITVRDVLNKMAATGGIDVEVRSDRVLLWKKADDGQIAELSKRLHDPDRWVRSEAAWDLSWLGDRRACVLLSETCADKDAGVSNWASLGLSRYLNVLPYVDVDKRAATATAMSTAELDARAEVVNCRLNFLGALSTPEGTAKLIELAGNNNKVVRRNAIRALSFDTDPHALKYILQQCAQIDNIKRPEDELPWDLPETLLSNALMQMGGLDAINLLSAWSATPLTSNRGKHRAGCAIGALSSLHDTRATDAALRYLIDRKNFAKITETASIDAVDPRIADAILPYISDPTDTVKVAALNTICRARDARALPVLLDMLRDPKMQDSWCAESLIQLRDPRAEQEGVKLILTRKPDASHDTDSGSRGQLQLALRNPTCIQKLFEVMKDPEKDLAERLSAAATLALWPGITPAQSADFIAWLKSAKPEFMIAALFHSNMKQEKTWLERYGRPAFDRDPQWITLLSSLIHNPDQLVGQSAAIALAESQGPYALKACIALMSTDMQLRSTIIQRWNSTYRSQIWCGDPQFADALASYVNSDDLNISSAVAILLGMRGDARAPVSRLEELALQPDDQQGAFVTISGNDYTPISALVALCLSGHNEATEALVRLIQRAGDKGDLLGVALSTDNAAITKVIEANVHDPKLDASARAGAALAVFYHVPGRKVDPAFKGTLVEFLADNGINGEYRGMITLAMLHSDDAGDVERFFQVLKKLPAEHQLDCIRSIGYANPNFETEIRERLLAIARDSNTDLTIRLETLSLMVKQEELFKSFLDLRAVKLMIELIKTANMAEKSRRTLFSVLAKCKDPEAVTAVKDVITHGTTHDRLLAAISLAWVMHDERSIDDLILCLETDSKFTEAQKKHQLSAALDLDLPFAAKNKVQAALNRLAPAGSNPFEQNKAKGDTKAPKNGDEF